MNRQPITFIDRRREWPADLTSTQLEAFGKPPLPLQEFVVKVHSRCNLACDYCYIYEMADQSWQAQPPSMSTEVAQRVATRIAEHAREHGLDEVSIVLHGGEPLMLGVEHLRSILEIFSTTLSPVTRCRLGMQTNALLLTQPRIAVLGSFDVRIGISLDGDRRANDKHRKRRNGIGTFDVVAERIETLRQGPFAHLFGGILATVDVANDPVSTYDTLQSFAPPSIDFLLPHGNWTEPPPFLRDAKDATPYADWMIAVFDTWFDSVGDAPHIGYFEQIIRGLHNLPSHSELIGTSPVVLATIETDGSYELVDTLKSTFDGATKTGMNAFDHAIDALLTVPSIWIRQLGVDALSSQCRECELVKTCGAGYFPHRYRQGSGFLNPSVYCHDLQKIINHIASVVEC